MTDPDSGRGGGGGQPWAGRLGAARPTADQREKESAPAA